MTEIILINSDGQQFKIREEVAKKFGTIRDVMEDIGIEEPIPLNLSNNSLSKVIQFAEYHLEHPIVDGEISEWDKQFFNVDQSIIFDLILLSNYLDYNDLLGMSCEAIASMIRGKSPAEIRKVFNIEDDFTEEEHQKIRQENEWLEER